MYTTAMAKHLLDPIPANSLLGLEVSTAESGYGRASIVVMPEVTNSVGSLHSSGLTALVEAAGLAAIISLAIAPGELDGVIPVGTGVTMHILAPARGIITARCALTRAATFTVRSLLDGETGRARLTTQAELTDERGVRVCAGRIQWSLNRPRLKPAE